MKLSNDHLDSVDLVFVIGAGRSGTTFLADLIGLHPEAAKLPEKRYLWSYGAYWRSHDIRGPEDASPKIRSYIEKYLFRRAKSSGRHYLIEKTPSNCFRVGFLSSLFPEAKFIHIIRDGRDVAISSARAFFGEKSLVNGKLDSTQGQRTFMQRSAQFSQRFPQFLDRFKERDIPPSGWLSYLFNNVTRVGQMFFSSKPPLWGARFPGISAARKAYSPIELAGIQWRESVSSAMHGLKKFVPEHQVLEIRYENLVHDPIDEMQRIFDFIGLSVDSVLLEQLSKSVRPSQTARQRIKDDENLDDLISHIKSSLVAYGYNKLT